MKVAAATAAAIDDGYKRGLMSTLEGSAKHGHMCPPLSKLGGILGISSSKIHDLLNELRAEKKINWSVEYRGVGLGKVRMVTILATGAKTLRPEFQTGRNAAPKVEKTELERAKNALRRFYPVVFNAEVTEGKAGRGFVIVDKARMLPADVIALAQAKGAL